MPKYNDLNRDFYKAILAGKKDVFEVHEIKMINVPRL